MQALYIAQTLKQEHDEIFETHSSVVLVTDKYAYKIKKNVNFGFLDFSSLGKRKFYCEEEVRLNRIYTANLYIDTIPITLNNGKFSIGEDGEIIEYCVRMHVLDHNSVFSERNISNQDIQKLAKLISNGHNKAEVIVDTAYCNIESITKDTLDNFYTINSFASAIFSNQQKDNLKYLLNWTESKLNQLRPFFIKRHHDGFVRVCHGDLHTGNIATYKNEITLFDCIDFNTYFVNTDTASDIAFLLMDLEFINQHKHGYQKLANLFLNDYLENSNDYEMLCVLNFYKLYRTMVRAKIALLSASSMQIEIDDTQSKFNRYLQLALQYTTHTKQQFIAITCGISGSGKSTKALELVYSLGAIRIRSDYVRSILFNTNHQHNKYSPELTEEVYIRLLESAAYIISKGYSVLLDATYIQYKYRDLVYRFAFSHALAYIIIYTHAGINEIAVRIKSRKNDLSEADMNIVKNQMRIFDEFTDKEQKFVIDASTSAWIEQIHNLISVFSI